MLCTKEFSEWEADKVDPGHTYEEFKKAQEILREVQAWADSQHQVVVVYDGWRATAMPVRPQDNEADFAQIVKPHWILYVKEHCDRSGNPYPEETMWYRMGDYAGIIHGTQPPTEETIINMIQDWVENCE